VGDKKMQTKEDVKTAKEVETELKKVLNIIGIFIFGGLALTSVTNPPPADYLIEYLLFIAGSAFIYYFLVNVYFLGQSWRKVFYGVIIVLGVGSLAMALLLLSQSTH
jgi:hypothetical protein